MRFVAIDCETANPSYASICQIGLAEYCGATIEREWKSYINPEEYFHPWNVHVHGIDFPVVENSPRLPELHEHLLEWLNDRVLVCHTSFDQIAVLQAFKKYDLSLPNSVWLDSARVARRTWAECAYSGYGLYSVCERTGYKFAHHDALEDAKAAAQVLLAASSVTGLGLDEWINRVSRPISTGSPRRRSGTSWSREGNPEGPLFGEVAVFTGALHITRGSAVDMAANLGCKVADSVNKRTTMLIVGDQDVRRLAGQELSSKHRRAEENRQ